MTHPYTTLEYANSLRHVGRPFHVPEWDTWLMIREIQPGFSDATGVYPITVLNKKMDISGGLKRLKEEKLISVVLVLDDFHRPDLIALQPYFSLIKPFKTHYVYQRDKPFCYAKHHRYELRQALKTVEVKPFNLKKEIESWVTLYDNLITHRKLKGLHAFPKEHHLALAKLEGMVAIGAFYEAELVCCHIWAKTEHYVHSHLAASTGKGYATRAAYAVNDAALHYFSDAKVINFGGGVTEDALIQDGLIQFKKGFANTLASSYLCGAILDDIRYNELVLTRGKTAENAYFPRYRAPII